MYHYGLSFTFYCRFAIFLISIVVLFLVAVFHNVTRIEKDYGRVYSTDRNTFLYFLGLLIHFSILLLAGNQRVTCE